MFLILAALWFNIEYLKLYLMDKTFQEATLTHILSFQAKEFFKFMEQATKI